MLGKQIFSARGSAQRANICAPSMLGEQLARRCARRTSPSTLAEQRAEFIGWDSNIVIIPHRSVIQISNQ
uniref:Uncharacterized protein n=1 Tax=Romanomermis culicivorax TaxID=13658 RepID=A0A915II23_ROMCU